MWRAQEDDPESVLNYVRMLLKLRQSYPALGNVADYSVLYAEEKSYPFVYRRDRDGEAFIVAVNPRNSASSCNIELPLDAKPESIIKEGTTLSLEGDSWVCRMEPIGYAIYMV